MAKYDFTGWATRNNLKCGDGRTIMKDAFKDNDGEVVPLVWNHQHDGADNVLGHALLENREDGVYVYGSFNDNPTGRKAKNLVQHGDITHLSIFANKLKHDGANVVHGAIREVSLVLAGANPGAYIDSVMMHGDDSFEEGTIYNADEFELELFHSDDEEDKKDKKKEESKQEEPKEPKEEKKEEPKEEKMAEDKTLKDVFDTLNEEQKTAVYAMIGMALEDAEGGAEDEGEEMKHNLFDNEYEEMDVLSHADIEMILDDAKRYGSLRDSFLAHTADYGIEHIDYLFPEAKSLNTPPDFIKREMDWVQKVMAKVHHTPFSRIKSTFADITEDEARAKGYIKGKRKKEEVFSLLKRTTTPTTIYKKQKLDRDDVIDITDFDVVAWLKSEMRMMLDEEIARAVLVGDGRLASSDDKINELNIRPIWKDDSLYTIKRTVDSNADMAVVAKNFIKESIRARKEYKGSGNPTCFITEDLLTECLLLEDQIGHRLYKNVEELATAMRVSEIVEVPVMENLKTEGGDSLAAIIVNLADYNVGADKGGAVSMFDDFDIDYNQQKYLIETRCSGALIKPYSAIAIEIKKAEG